MILDLCWSNILVYSMFDSFVCEWEKQEEFVWVRQKDVWHYLYQCLWIMHFCYETYAGCFINYIGDIDCFAKSHRIAQLVHVKYGNPIRIMLKWTQCLEIFVYMYGIGSAKRKKTMNPFETFAYTFHISYGLFIHIRIFKTIAWNSMYEKFHSGSVLWA